MCGNGPYFLLASPDPRKTQTINCLGSILLFSLGEEGSDQKKREKNKSRAKMFCGLRIKDFTTTHWQWENVFSERSVNTDANELAVHIRWPRYWSFSISPSNKDSGLTSRKIDWLGLLAVQGTLRHLFQHQVFPSESALRIRWPKCWSFSVSISPSNEYSGLISFRTDGFDLFAETNYWYIFNMDEPQKYYSKWK